MLRRAAPSAPVFHHILTLIPLDGRWQLVSKLLQHKKEDRMPYVNIKITKEGATPAQKAELIAGVTELLVRVLDKNPATTTVVIDEVALEDWGIGGLPVEEFRARAKAGG